MTSIPTIARNLVAAEQYCHFVHYFPSFCDLDAAPEAIEPSTFSATGKDSADAASGIDDVAYKIIYDVMRTRNGRILFKQSYADRFSKSLALATPTHELPAELSQKLQERLQRYVDAPGVFLDNLAEQNLKIFSWVADGAAGTSPIPVIFLLSKSSYPPESMYRDGAKFGLLYNAHRVNPNLKIAQTALRDRANAFQRDNGLFEVLLVHNAADHYLVPEGSRSNYLLQRRDGSWWCSAPEDILVGITLQTTYRVMQACGFGDVQHAKLDLSDILSCKALYMLGTSPTILPIRSILLYRDDETRLVFEDAVQALNIDLVNSPCIPIQQASDASAAVLPLFIDVELAARLRAQYFTEAALS